jgi:predicted O-methyltransferase YrrM
MLLPIEIIKYFVLSKGRHGIHSPFVYDFIDKCLKTKLKEDFLIERADLFSVIKQSKEIITVQDFGAGSKKLKKFRKISSLFKTSSSKGKYADLLYRIADYYKPNSILEFGTSLGIGTIHLQKGNPSSKITTIEACNETRSQALKHFESFNLSINSVNSTFQDYLNDQNIEKFDLIFVDGHHDGAALQRYIEQLEKNSHNETMYILDDIRWSSSMFEAWKQLIQSEKFHVTIDLFRVGIIIPRKQQKKQHFVIRY